MSPAASKGRRSSVAAGLEPDADVLSIAQLYARIDRALVNELPPRVPIWVRGEVQTLSDRTGHCYIDLVDPDQVGDRQAPVLKVRCWRQTWGPLRAQLERAGLDLAPGTVVHLVGRVEFYRARAEINFVMAGLDVTALLGRMAAEKAELIERLRSEGMLEANRSRPLPPVALRVALVASPETEGYRDFVGQLSASGYSFHVEVARALVQGADAPVSLARAIRRAGESDCDLVVVVRGGGSKGDLVAFDSEPVARAIAKSPLAVWTGIGHTGDESVADIVANRSFVTPTECGHELVVRADAWWQRFVAGPAGALSHHAAGRIEAADRHLSACRGRLSGTARQQVGWHHERLAGRVAALLRGAPAALGARAAALEAAAGRISPAALRALGAAEARAATWRRLLGAFDVDRQLERGYTLTMDQDGKILRSGNGLSDGDVLVTRFADTTARSVVEGAGGAR